MGEDKLFEKLAINKVKTQSDLLAEKIKGMIVSGEFGEGYKFPNETEFSKILNVSRATLREAYKILVTEGYISRSKNGTSVRSKEEVAEKGNFYASMELADKDELEEFICLLEPDAVFLATQKITKSELKELKKLMEDCDASVGNHSEFMDANYQFHAFIRNLSNNDLIISALKAYYDDFHQNVIANIYYGNEDVTEFRNQSLKEHHELYEAMRKGDAEKARQIDRNHLLEDIAFRKQQKKR